MKLGLKCNIEDNQFLNRLEKKPHTIEFHLREEDLFGGNRKKLEERIEICVERGIKVFIHQPMSIYGETLNILAKEPLRIHFLEVTTLILKEICLKYKVQCVIHMNYGDVKRDYEIYDKNKDVKSQYEYLIRKTIEFVDRHDKDREFILIENSINGWGSYKGDLLLARGLSKTNIRLCFDVSHAFISLDNETSEEKNKYLLETIHILDDNIHYYHVVDSSCLEVPKIHDSLQVGKGLINWNDIKQYIIKKDYIFEVNLKSQGNCMEMVDSYHFLRSIK